MGGYGKGWGVLGGMGSCGVGWGAVGQDVNLHYELPGGQMGGCRGGGLWCRMGVCGVG